MGDRIARNGYPGGMSDHPNVLARAVYLVVGGVLLLAGIALLVLPGPGLLLVLGGLLVLGHGFPAAQRFVDPVRRRALSAADESVSSPLRIAFSVLTGVALIVAGVVWATVPGLPLGGWATGSSLIFSGVVLLALLAFSARRRTAHVAQRRADREARQPAGRGRRGSSAQPGPS